MSKLLLVLFVALVGYGVYRLSVLYEEADAEERRGSRQAEMAVTPESQLPGLAPTLEASLTAATAAGAPALKSWLEANGRFVPEPRLSAVQLDYARLLIRSNPAEAKRIFQAVRSRTSPDSPLAPRIAQLAKTFQ